MESKKRNKSKFKSNLKKYILILCVFSAIFLIYVMNTLYQYEASFTDNYMKEVVQDITKSAKKGKLNKFCDFSNIKVNNLELNKDSSQKTVENVIKTSNITYQLEKNNKSAQECVYGIYANEDKIMNVSLNAKKQNKRLGLFSYPVWQVKECSVDSENGIYYYNISVPSNYTVTVNSTKLSEEYISDAKSYNNSEVFEKYVKLPKMVNYRLNNFVSKPNIKIVDETGKEISYEIKGHKVEIDYLYKTVSDYETAKKYLAQDINVLDIAEKWSLFLTDDLEGDSHGFSQLKKYLIKGTGLYSIAYNWATSIDITFTSKHTLKNPTFTNAKVSDFEIYGKNAFSCNVYLEKNMKISNGNDKVDVMHDKLYFVYYDDTQDGVDNPQWKMIEMKSITEK